jgi:hypothetical protein
LNSARNSEPLNSAVGTPSFSIRYLEGSCLGVVGNGVDAVVGGSDADDGGIDDSIDDRTDDSTDEGAIGDGAIGDGTIVTDIDIGVVVKVGIGCDCDGKDELRVTEAETMLLI